MQSTPWIAAKLLADIQVTSFLWIRNGSRIQLPWTGWLPGPLQQAHSSRNWLITCGGVLLLYFFSLLVFLPLTPLSSRLLFLRFPSCRFSVCCLLFVLRTQARSCSYISWGPHSSIFPLLGCLPSSILISHCS